MYGIYRVDYLKIATYSLQMFSYQMQGIIISN